MALWQVVRASCGKVAGRNSPLWKGSGNNLLRLHFSSTSEFALWRLPCWQEMLLTKRNIHCPNEWEDRGICFQIESSLLLPYLLPSRSAFPSAYKYSQVSLILNNKKEQNKTLLLLLPPQATTLSLSFLSQLGCLKEPPIHFSAHCNLASVLLLRNQIRNLHNHCDPSVTRASGHCSPSLCLPLSAGFGTIC